MDTRFQYRAYRYFLFWGILSSLALTLCTICDAALVGNIIGSDGLAVSNLATPVYLVYALFSITIGVGGNVKIMRLLGSGDRKAADSVFHSQLSLGLFVSLLSLSPLLFKEKFFSFLGVTENLYALSSEYLTVVMYSSPLFVMYHILSYAVRSDSDAFRSAAASTVVIVTNLVLDIIFMKVMRIGIMGASLSLCIGEALGVIVLLTHFAGKNRMLTLKTGRIRLHEVCETVSNGFGLGSAQVFSAVVMLLYNTMLLKYWKEDGTFYVAVYGIIYTLSTIPQGIWDGNSSSLQTVISFLTGESDTAGISAVLKKSLLTVSSLALVTALLFALFPSFLLSLFGLADSSGRGAEALSIFSLSLVFTALNTAVTAFWQAIGRNHLASLLSAVRNCALLLITGFILIPGMNVTGLALSYVITEAVSAVFAAAVALISSSRTYLREKYGIYTRSFEKTYLIEKESMEAISGDLGRTADEWNLDLKKSFMINFITEEILLNIIKFALGSRGGRREYYISVKLIEKDDGLVLRIRDNVRQYNPFEAEGDEIDSGVLELIKKKTKYSEYQRKIVFNYFYTII